MSERRLGALLADQSRLGIGVILLLALTLRLGHVLVTQEWPDISGGDYRWYAQEGHVLVRTGWMYGAPQTGPVFLLIAGYAEELIPPAFGSEQPGWLLLKMFGGPALFPGVVGTGQSAIRLLHVLLGTLTVLMVYRIGRAAWQNEVGLIAAFVIAINPIFIIEAGNLTTESLAIFLMTWSLALWLERVSVDRGRLAAATGALLAVGALTRSVLLGLPAVFISHLLVKFGWRRMLRDGLVLLLGFLLVLSSWTVFNLLTWNHFTLAGQGMLGMLYVGATGWRSPEEVDADLGFESEAVTGMTRDESYRQGLQDAVLSDPVGYAARRVSELAGALLQPHNTTFYAGESIKTLVLTWLREDRSPGGLLAVLRADYFWPKLLLYLFHYAGLVLGLTGIALNWRRWRDLWPLLALFGYIGGIHLALSAIPRYLFPLEVLWWVFGAAAIMHIWRRRTTT